MKNWAAYLRFSGYAIWLGLWLALMMGCAANHELRVISPENSPPDRISLSWENTTAPHPERALWSDKIIELFKKDLQTFKKSSDISFFCPKFQLLGEVGQLRALGEIWVAVAYYESGYKPENSSVDVGTKSNKDTWSVGLYQMSVVDQKNYRLSFGYTYDDLVKPLPNIELSLAVLKAQVIKRGVIAVLRPNPGVYWAVLRDKSPEIALRVQKNALTCK